MDGSSGQLICLSDAVHTRIILLIHCIGAAAAAAAPAAKQEHNTADMYRNLVHKRRDSYTLADEDVDAALALPSSHSEGCMHTQGVCCLLASVQTKRRCLSFPANIQSRLH